MTQQQRSPWDFYAPTDLATLPRQTQTAPAEQPSLSDIATANYVLMRDDIPGSSARRYRDAWQPYIDVLNEGRPWWKRYSNPWASPRYDRMHGPNLAEPEAWALVEERLARDPEAFRHLPRSLDALHEGADRPVRVERAQARGIVARNQTWTGSAVGLGASALTAMRDPVQVATLPLGGGARTLLTRALASAATNAGISAIELPGTAHEREALGEELTGREAALNVGAAGLLGAGFELGAAGIARGAGAAAPRVGGAVARGRQLARDMRERIGWTRMTDEERAATVAVEREADVADTSPLTGGGAVEAHLARVDEAMRHLDDPGAYARTMGGMSAERPANLTGREAPAPGRVNVQGYAQKIARVESGGRWDAQAATSSAYGLYQITRGTALRYVTEGEWARRSNPAMQERVFRALTEDNRKALARAGVPETEGNLYLAHFAGSGAATKVLKAARDTPVSELLSARAIEANPTILKGRTAGELIDWAHRKMGQEAPDGPVLSREGFADDEAGDLEWRAAQDEVEAAEARLRELDREADDAPAARDDGTVPDDDVPFDLYDPRARAFDGEQRDPFAGLDDEPAPVRVDGVEEAPAIVATRRGDFFELTGDRAAEAASILEVALTRNRAGEPMIGIPAHSADRYAQLLRDGGIDVRLDDPSAPRPGSDGLTFHDRAFGDEGTGNLFTYREGENALHGVVRLNGDRLDLDVNGGGANLFGPAFTRRALRALQERFPDAASIGGLRTSGARGDTGVEIDVPLRGRDDTGPPAPLTGFDHPDDVAAARQIDSLEHDLRMWLAEDEAAGVTVRLTDDGDVISAADAMADLDADDAAIAAARNCMVPGGEA